MVKFFLKKKRYDGNYTNIWKEIYNHIKETPTFAECSEEESF
jgi:hypothetical protein